MFTSSTAREWRFSVLGVSLLLLVIVAAPAFADPSYELYGTYGFKNLSNLVPGTESLFTLKIYSVVGVENQVLFNFSTAASAGDAFIGKVYFYDGALVDSMTPVFAEFGTTEGVSFENTTEDNKKFWNWTVDGKVYSAVKDTGLGGVNAGESLSIQFVLGEDFDFTDVISTLNLSGESIHHPGTVQIGIHAMGLPGGKSDWMIATPVPGAALLGLLGLGYAGMRLRKIA
jgi:hypothetical protein